MFAMFVDLLYKKITLAKQRINNVFKYWNKNKNKDWIEGLQKQNEMNSYYFWFENRNFVLSVQQHKM